MFKQFRLAISVACLFWAFGVQYTAAQTPADRQAQSPLVTAASSAESVRFTAPAKVYEMRLEVFAADGQTLYDSDFKFGNLLDWGLHDQQGQRLADGSYQCVVTVRALYGRASRKQGILLLQDGQPTFQATKSPQAIKSLNLPAASESGDFLALPNKDVALSLTTLAHDGRQGRLVSGSGGLSFRTGDFFMGKDVERMRLTAEGRLGIGVENPQEKLDVGGLIRTSEGIVFPDGSVQTTAYVAAGRTIGERAGMQRDTGDRSLAEPGNKNSAGGLGPPVKTTISDDLTINGNIIFTSPSVGYTRDITMENNNYGLRFFGASSLSSSPAAAAIQFWGNGNTSFPGQLYLDSGAHDSAALIFRTTGTGGTIAERMRVTATGNVGIGTNSPNYKLHVVGNGSGTTAMYVQNNPGTAIFGENVDGSSYAGVRGKASTTTTAAYGVLGEFISSSGGNGYGVYGSAQSTSEFYTIGYGVYGTAPKYGVYGKATKSGGFGVYGESTFSSGGNGIGVYGKSDSGGTAVYGDNSNTASGNYAGYFNGRVYIAGPLEKPAGSFKIDHPLDPANKYLYHSFVESPDMKNIYDGNVTTDDNGDAEVALPDYFEVLNRDFRYQLTVIGQFAQAVIAEKIKDNRFKIKTSFPNVEVSWQVTGIRRDAYAEAHRIQVEEEKPACERGSYLHPEVHGQPEEKGAQLACNPETMRQWKEQREQERAQKEKKLN